VEGREKKVGGENGVPGGKGIVKAGIKLGWRGRTRRKKPKTSTKRGPRQKSQDISGGGESEKGEGGKLVARE